MAGTQSGILIVNLYCYIQNKIMKARFTCINLLILFLFFSSISFAQKETKAKSTEQKEKTPKSSKYEIQGPYCNGLARVRMNKKWGYIDKNGAEIVKPKYIQVENFNEGLARVRGQKGWGLIDTTGTIILVAEFNYISDFTDGKALVRMIGGQETYINKKGQNIGGR